jgi:hypothetical protein
VRNTRFFYWRKIRRVKGERQEERMRGQEGKNEGGRREIWNEWMNE